MKIKFGAFIITYDRPEILRTTIEKVFDQTISPEKVLIVDNSLEKSAEETVKDIGDDRITYHSMGYNSGPAGGAYFALNWYANSDFEWIYWGDDDNPPVFKDSFERIFSILDKENQNKVGILGAVGQRFDFKGAKVIRLDDGELEKVIDVDIMAGGSYMIINLKTVREGIVPNPDLFFGFEEFDLCLKMKKEGYKLLVNGDLMRDYRINYGKFGLSKRQLRIKRPKELLWRDYYSIRNIIFIFSKTNDQYRGIAMIRTFAALGKIVVGFRYGLFFGLKNARILIRAIIDGWSGRLGLNQNI